MYQPRGPSAQCVCPSELAGKTPDRKQEASGHDFKAVPFKAPTRLPESALACNLVNRQEIFQKRFEELEIKRICAV